MKNLQNIVLAIMLATLLFGCKQKDENEYGNELGKTETKADPINVEGVIAVFGSFPLEFVSNGKLMASQQAELYFTKNQIVKEINVKNGDWVKVGAVLASLENELDLINLKQAEFQLESAKIDLDDKVITHSGGQVGGGRTGEKALNHFALSSGFKSAELNLQKAKIDYESTTLKAPFSGRVADLETKVMNLPKGGDPFCRLLNDKNFEVVFPILESEIGRLKVGQAVSMRPYVEDSVFYTGKIIEINPIVDENGLVVVKAIVPNTDGKLIQGMNVKVFIKDQVEDCLIVPKEAVVLRNNRQVVFTFSEGVAMWNYVETVLENSVSYSVTKEKDGMQEIFAGDTVITIGNLNLAHEAEVKFRMIK
ncbi:MAG: efflux RND transporter periplasmic adaptor subunit [Bacteroidales bacterium]|nr:efflux RND transporter periplasmic adaptor subunit [Bacteroidales bacterium]